MLRATTVLKPANSRDVEPSVVARRCNRRRKRPAEEVLRRVRKTSSSQVADNEWRACRAAVCESAVMRAVHALTGVRQVNETRFHMVFQMSRCRIGARLSRELRDTRERTGRPHATIGRGHLWYEL